LPDISNHRCAFRSFTCKVTPAGKHSGSAEDQLVVPLCLSSHFARQESNSTESQFSEEGESLWSTYEAIHTGTRIKETPWGTYECKEDETLETPCTNTLQFIKQISVGGSPGYSQSDDTDYSEGFFRQISDGYSVCGGEHDYCVVSKGDSLESGLSPKSNAALDYVCRPDIDFAVLSAQKVAEESPHTGTDKEVHIDPTMRLAGLRKATRSQSWSKVRMGSIADLDQALDVDERATVKSDEARTCHRGKEAIDMTLGAYPEPPNEPRVTRRPYQYCRPVRCTEKHCTKDDQMIPTVPEGPAPRPSFRKAAAMSAAQQCLEQSF